MDDQNERETKRQKRMERNRQSARASRLRKQAELDGLRQMVESLTKENKTLKELSQKVDSLSNENKTLKELSQKVDSLSNENRTLREKFHRLSEEKEKLYSEYKSLKGVVTVLSGPGAVSGGVKEDKRETKRQKRMQRNRRSARASRLRKKAELDDLRQKVESLTKENNTHKQELRRVSEEHEKLSSKYNFLKGVVKMFFSARGQRR